jgi:hypothetical protein
LASPGDGAGGGGFPALGSSKPSLPEAVALVSSRLSMNAMLVILWGRKVIISSHPVELLTSKNSKL